MKCPVCDGTGKVVHPMMSMNGDEYTGEWEQHECEMCGGTGEIQQTNEEWIHTLNTEQLAELLTDIQMDGFFKMYCMTYKERVEWLKQPHTFK